MIWYRTEWTEQVTKRKGPNAGKRIKEHHHYETKSHTNMHKHLREKYNVYTLKCDDSIPWPFGVFAEVCARPTMQKS